MNKEQLDYLIQGINTFAWNANFLEFCEVLDIDPKHDYAQQKWQQWKLLTKGLQGFDEDKLQKLVEAGYKNSNAI
ncbi:hypothetical protein GS682_32715 [Nostoc sp. B(2019)]|nr:hypothetical protein [Nostoc sp. B(2019)]